MLRIGHLSFDVPAVHAALAGFSDAAMRRIARRYGCPYAVSEGLLDRAVLDGGRGHRVVELPDDDHPVGGQLLGSDPAELADAARTLAGAGYDVVDVNFGCPVRKVMGRCRGGFLLGEPDTAIAIVRAVRDAVPARVPVTLKMRRGIDDGDQSADHFFRILDAARAAGVAAVTVHGRSVRQLYTGRADWAFLAGVKRHVGGTLTVIGSGDLMSAGDVQAMLTATGVDGASLARGAIGNPWLFAEVRAALAGRPPPGPPSLAEQADVMADHYGLAEGLYGPVKGEMVLRKFLQHYCRRHPDPAGARRALLECRTAEQRRAVLERWYRRWDGAPVGPTTGSGVDSAAMPMSCGDADGSGPRTAGEPSVTACGPA